MGLPEETIESRLEGYRQFAFATRLLLEPIGSGGDTSGQLLDHDRANPACHLLRQTIELALKIAEPSMGHSLRDLLERVRVCATEIGRDVPETLVDLIHEFACVDPRGTNFRYAAESGAGNWCCVDPARLRQDLDELDRAVTDLLLGLANAA
jgi:hypothetical protein